MKFSFPFGVASFLAFSAGVTTPLQAETTVRANIGYSGTNAVTVSCTALAGKSYVIRSTTNLALPWQSANTTPSVLIATTNSLAYTFPIEPGSRFFQVVKLDTEGPEVRRLSPLDGGIAVSPRATIQVWLQDETGIDPETIQFSLGGQVGLTLDDSRLAHTNGLLTYTTATNEVLGALGEIVTASLSVSDILGNHTTNFTWSFQLELPPVLSTNILFLGRAPVAYALATTPSLTLIATNGDLFTYRYTGTSSGISVGLHLIDPDLQSGYTRTVVSFTEHPESSTVVVLTRPTKLAELLEQGSLSSSSTFTQRTTATAQVAGFAPTPWELTKDFELRTVVDLSGEIYQEEDFTVELQPGSRLNLSATLALAANFRGSRLTEFEAAIAGIADFNVTARAVVGHGWTFEGDSPLIEPIHHFYAGVIGGVPVWVETVLELNVGFSAEFGAYAGITAGIAASKELLFGRRFDAVDWHDIFESPPPAFTFTGPSWQINGTAGLRAHVQPKVRLLVYSLAGVSADLQSYLELGGRLQPSPYYWELGLCGGLSSTLALDLRVWDDSWGELPSKTFDLIPCTTLWSRNSLSEPPQIITHPQSQNVVAGSAATFMVEARGNEPLSYQWQRNGVNLGDGDRISGARSSTLGVADVRLEDVGNYTVVVRNSAGTTTSATAVLGLCPPDPSNVVLVASLETSDRAEAVDVAGIYAYMGGQDAGLEIIDVSNPANPVRVGRYDSSTGNAGGNAVGLQVIGPYAYVGTQDAGLEIIDVSNPTNPVRVGAYRGGAEHVHVVGDYAYITHDDESLRIIDVSDPANPVLAGSYPAGGRAVHVVGNYAYVASISTSATLKIIDVSDPANPVRVGFYSGGCGYDVQVVGSYAYVACDGLQIIDVSNPASPVRVGGYDTSGPALGVQIVCGYAYVADGNPGLQIIDVSNPANPVRVGGYDTSGYALDVEAVGNYIYIADGSGLVILKH